jgi:hypothetical protein
VLLLDNDTDIIARNSLGNIVGSLPVVNAMVCEGDDLVIGQTIGITPPGTDWKEGINYKKENVVDNRNI